LKIGIVGSWEKGHADENVSLQKFLSTGVLEVFCPAAEFMDFSMSTGMPVSLKKGAHSWKGEIKGGRIGVLSDKFTPKEFRDAIGKNSVGVYLVRLSSETPVNEHIIGVDVSFGGS
jgi:hypothetical protein